jgi:branched-chain amino acid aminotransferase
LVWKDGEMIEWDQAQDNNFTHTMHYGSWVFEGIRFYDTPKWPKIFRLEEHIDRLMYSAKVFEMWVEHLKDEIKQACLDIVEKSDLKSGYIRPIIYFGDDRLWLNPSGISVHSVVGAWGWWKYLWDEPLRVKIPNIRRIDPRTVDMNAKICGNYVNSITASLEIKKWWYDEGLLLDTSGNIAEGPGENIFFLGKKWEIYTPKLGAILPGITRATIIELFKDKYGIDVVEETISPERLWEFEEAFFVGTAAEVTPIASITDQQGEEFEFSSCDEASKSNDMKKKYLDVVSGKDSDYLKYLS